MARRADAVHILERRFGYFPKRFRWRGRQFDVIGVPRVWCAARRWPRPAQERRYELLTTEGRFELAHDLLRDAWTVRRAPALPRAERRRTMMAVEGTIYGHRLALVR
jgi:hypothetical protein